MTGHLESIGIDIIILKFFFKEMDRMVWTGIIWLRIEKSGGLLERIINFGLHKVMGIYLVAKKL